MNMINTKFNSYNILLDTITPLHIGNDEKLSSVGEFITTTSKIRYLDTNKISQFLYENNKIDDYSEKIIQSAQGFDTLKVLEELGFDVENSILNEIELGKNTLNVLHNNILHVFIEAYNRKYIPGSSLKGMIKTVLLYHYLRNNKNILKQIEEEIENQLYKENSIYGLKGIWEKYENQIFKKNEFNFLRFADSPCITDDLLQVEQVKRQHLFNIDSKGLDWLAETIKSDISIPLRFQILPEFSQNQSILNSWDITQLFGIMNDYSLTMIDFEINMLNLSSFFEKVTLISKLNEIKKEIKQSENKYALCRLGKGKTVYFNTLWPLLTDKVLKKVIEKLYKSEDSEKLFPATRVLTINDEMLGWIRISEIEPKFKHNHIENESNKNEDKVIHIVEIIPAQNQISSIEVQITELKVTVSSTKTVSFVLNQVNYVNVQLINPYKKTIQIGEVITVTVWQLNKSGNVNQVKIEDL